MDEIIFKIYATTDELPSNWNDFAIENIFLSKEYLKILEKSAPKNMTCHFIALFRKDELVGIALSQFLNLNQLESFGERDKCLKASFRNMALKNFCSHVLIIGNNMLTGQNAFVLSDTIDKKIAFQLLEKATETLQFNFKKKGFKTHITVFKDFSSAEIIDFKGTILEKKYPFSTQPNMVFDIATHWKTAQDYIDALSKKYRDQYKRVRKKAIGIEKKKMNLEDIVKNEAVIYELYFHVAENAPFNTFILPKNHFSVFKEIMKDKFLFYGYFLEGKMIGFNTLIKNSKTMDTYFLGYDDAIQRDKMLYLNMLYDMIAYSINKGFDKIIFGRTALEIKSAVGAKPQEMFCLLKHSNPIIHKSAEKILCFLEPKQQWNERNPFK